MSELEDKPYVIILALDFKVISFEYGSSILITAKLFSSID